MIKPRQKRKESLTKIYHCILRGINKQDVFFDNQDFLKFKKEMIATKEKYHYKLYSYVLMSNHIHLEIKAEKNDLPKIMQRMQISYISYFNKKYDRTGSLYDDRYKCKCVESDEYIVNLMRYIHQNPEVAGIEKTNKYKWSSYKDYFDDKSLIDKDEILNLIGEHNYMKKFIQLNRQIVKPKTSRELLEYEMQNYLKDNQIIEIIKNEFNIENVHKIQQYSKKERNEVLKKLKANPGTRIKSLSRVLGISEKIIQRA